MDIKELRQNYRNDILKIADKYGAENIRVFGSTIRGDSKKNSDIDFLVHYKQDADLFDVVGLKDSLEELLGKKVDIVSDRTIFWYIRDKVLKEANPL